MNALRLLLIVSLLGNAALGGFIASRAFNPPVPPAPVEAAGAPPELRAFGDLRRLRRLPPEERAPARAAIEAQLPDLRAAGRNSAMALRALDEAMHAEPFDADAARAAAAALAQARADQAEITTGIIIDVFETLSPERRAQFLESRAGSGPRPGERLRERMRERAAERRLEEGASETGAPN